MKIICEDRRSRMKPSGNVSGRIATSVSADVDRLLGPKSLEQLSVLEMQISEKLRSNEPIDVEYWEHLLRNIGVYKAKAELKKIYKSVIESRLQALKVQQITEAELVQEKMSLLSEYGETIDGDGVGKAPLGESKRALSHTLSYSAEMDPEPMLKVKAEDKNLDVVEESEFLDKIVNIRHRTRNNRTHTNTVAGIGTSQSDQNGIYPSSPPETG